MLINFAFSDILLRFLHPNHMLSPKEVGTLPEYGIEGVTYLLEKTLFRDLKYLNLSHNKTSA